MNIMLPKVLVVDDEAGLLLSLVAFLEDENFDVQGASSGEDALEILNEHTIDVVIVDMRLPGIDGNEVILRAKKDGIKAKFIIHTGSTDYQLPLELKQLGFKQEHIFLKPLDNLQHLSDAVRKICQNAAL